VDFEELRRSWQHLGATDPRWAILSDPGREGGGWDDAAFWQSGERFVHWLALHLDGLSALPVRGHALDFGCGHGRLTQALAAHFAEVTGVDIAASMLAAARTTNRHGDRVRYVHNEHPDLRAFADASFDFVLSVLVLQHMRPDYAQGYLREFLRVLRPGGVLFVQLPVEPLAPPPASGPASGARVDPFVLRAHTTLLPPQVVLAAGQWQWFRVAVANAGAAVLPARGASVGTRWLRHDGSAASTVVCTPLPHDLAPGQSVAVLVPMRAPAAPGAYALQALLGGGIPFATTPTNVPAQSLVLVTEPVPGLAEAPSPPEPPSPQPPTTADAHGIEVHGTPLADVAATLATAGGTIVDVALDTWAGPQWLSAHVVVRKGSEAAAPAGG
jgi:SAM-dependent methyltransferase